MSSQANKQKFTKRQRQAEASTKQRQAAKKRSNDRNGSRAAHAQEPGTNAKTQICRFFEKNGRCPFGSKCNYAHGADELVSRKPRQFKSPCWWFNQPSGCTKSGEECMYEHILAPDMRKPIHLQHPCPFWHHRTPLQCRRGDKCGGDHFYELTADEWKHHFPDVAFPGVGYFERKPEPKPERKPEPKPAQSFNPEAEDFPVLCADRPDPKPVVGGAWGRPLSFKDAVVDGAKEVKPEPVKKAATTTRPGWVVLSPRGKTTEPVAKTEPVPIPVPAVTKTASKVPVYKPYKPRGRDWANSSDWTTDDDERRNDWWGSDDEEDLDMIRSRDDVPSAWDEDDDDSYGYTPQRPPVSRPPPVPRQTAPRTPPQPRKEPTCPPAPRRPTAAELREQELREQVTQLQSQVSQLTSLLSKDASKLPAMDGELKSLVTTALKQLLESQ